METAKEKLRERFIEFIEKHPTIFPDDKEINDVFDFFYQEIEASNRDSRRKIDNCHDFYKEKITKHVEYQKELEVKIAYITKNKEAEISRLQSLIEAADAFVEVVNDMRGFDCSNSTLDRFVKAREKYNQLKQQKSKP